jgi:hypothetical protein
MSTVGREHEPPEVLVGRWRTQGWTRESGTVMREYPRRLAMAMGVVLAAWVNWVADRIRLGSTRRCGRMAAPTTHSGL